MLRRLVTLAAPVVLAALVAGCGGAMPGSGEPKPDSVGAMARRAVVAAHDEKSVHYDLTGSAKATGPAADAPGSPLGDGANFELEGGLSHDAVTAEGNAKVGGKSYDAALRLGPQELFVKLLGTWYGSKETGLDKLEQGAKAEAGKRKPGLLEQLRQLQKVEQIANDVLVGTIGDGDDSTWRFDGKLDPDGLVRVAEQNGAAAPSDDDLETLRLLADSSRISFSIDKDGSLPRRIELAVDLSGDALARLRAQTGADKTAATDYDSVSVDLVVELDDWGEPVSIDEPADFQPLDKIFAGLLGAGGGGIVPFAIPHGGGNG